ncbi:TonB-dependent receptor [Hydrocarboniphaga effusa]|jgi:outer membrane receptor protein involved in Fe transport|uniref:TonB-dependent receptor n=1 Tax=Hydrocarboniphaga effusa TaxID=243629 RepID=UPI003137FF33
MKSLFKIVGAASLLCAPQAWSAELYLNTFLGTNPLKDLEVELDGRSIGRTDAQGAVVGQLEKGAHTLRIIEKEKKVTLTEYQFELAEGESADLSLTFTDFEKPPAASIDKYDPGQQGQGAPGVLQGYVLDGDNAPIAGATLRLQPSDITGTTDSNGSFQIEVPRGRYDLAVEKQGYDTARSSGLRIVSGVGLSANITLMAAQAVAADASTAGVEEIVVVGSYKASAKPIDIKRNSVAVTDAISVEELLKAGDSDVAASLKRVVGVSIQGGRFAVVRGLAGRYVSTTLNDDMLSSTDPYRRDVELDLFPADILSGIEIQKSFTADMPGDTTGGIIKIGTKGLPDEYINTLSANVGGTTGTTGEKMASYHGGDRDWFGYDDGTRKLPRSVLQQTRGGTRSSFTTAESAALAAKLPNEYNPLLREAAPDFGLSYALGNSFDADIGRIGAYGTVAYDRGVESRQDARRDTIIDPVRTEYDRDIFRTAVDGYFVAGIEASGGWKLYSKTTLLRETEDTTAVEAGIDVDDSTDPNNPINIANVMLEFRERQYAAEQLQASIPLFDDHNLALRMGVSQTSSETPDRRSYSYQGTTFIASSFERLYADLKEDAVDLGLDYTIPLQLTDDVKTVVKFGGLFNDRDRENGLVRLGVRAASYAILDDDPEALLTQQAFQNGSFVLRGLSLGTDTYFAGQRTKAGYVTTETSFGEAVTIVAGVRQDNFKTSLSFPNSTTAPDTELTSNELLPSLGAIYRLGDDWQFRAGYARTVSRPSITELAPSIFYDDRGRQFTGCTVQTVGGLVPCSPSDIDNFDLRAEYYLNRQDSISLALFHKEIDSPLERGYVRGSGSATNAFTFRNAESATVSGIELDGQLSWLLNVDHSVTAGANVSYIDSEIKLDAEGADLEGRSKRDLQGQSPWLANARLGYEHFPTQQTVTLTANYFDDRIDVTGRAPLAPVYEMGRVILNLTYEKEFANRSKVGVKLRNLLNDDIRFEQNGQVIERWKIGVNGELSYTYKF